MSPNEPEKLHKQKTEDNTVDFKKSIDLDEYISHTTLWYELKTIKEHELKHVKEEIDDLKEFTRENRNFFMERLDRLDARIWAIMGISVTTLIGIIASYILK